MFRNVFIGVDGTSHGRDAIALATVLAEPGARLTLAHVRPGARPPAAADRDLYASDPTYYSEGRLESRRLLEGERDAMGVAAQLITVAGPSVGPALHALAEEEAADLLVVGACKHRLTGRLLIGDDTRASVNGASSPVAIAPAGYALTNTPLETIGVHSDSSEESRAALALARELAARYGARVIALDVGGHPASDESPHTVAEPAEHVDLLVVRARRHGPLRGLAFGSSSVRLARHTHSPILVIPRTAVDDRRSPSAEANGAREISTTLPAAPEPTEQHGGRSVADPHRHARLVRALAAKVPRGDAGLRSRPQGGRDLSTDGTASRRA
ncbi:MAG: hypothetical protein QOH12_1724 [Solirubrobacteraceae bacterium]|jgi:nucleotide-binding universal stress UspA family protein|nr:hypothetical protein [Solirubrobacteraceae bacterium]